MVSQAPAFGPYDWQHIFAWYLVESSLPQARVVLVFILYSNQAHLDPRAVLERRLDIVLIARLKTAPHWVIPHLDSGSEFVVLKA